MSNYRETFYSHYIPPLFCSSCENLLVMCSDTSINLSTQFTMQVSDLLSSLLLTLSTHLSQQMSLNSWIWKIMLHFSNTHCTAWSVCNILIRLCMLLGRSISREKPWSSPRGLWHAARKEATWPGFITRDMSQKHMIKTQHFLRKDLLLYTCTFIASFKNLHIGR